MAVATPVAAARLGPVHLTNTDFRIDGAELIERLALSSLWIVNDFEALAWSLPTLRADELETIGTIPPRRDATMAVIGPGTGLGCAGLLSDESGWHAVAGEVTVGGERHHVVALGHHLDPDHPLGHPAGDVAAKREGRRCAAGDRLLDRGLADEGVVGAGDGARGRGLVASRVVGWRCCRCGCRRAST